MGLSPPLATHHHLVSELPSHERGLSVTGAKLVSSFWELAADCPISDVFTVPEVISLATLYLFGRVLGNQSSKGVPAI